VNVYENFRELYGEPVPRCEVCQDFLDDECAGEPTVCERCTVELLRLAQGYSVV
jgi:hypothetical protein